MESFLTLALSYDPAQNITSGFLTYRANKGNNGPLDHLLSDLKGAVLHAPHPMLLPLLILRRGCYWLQTHHDYIEQNLRNIQRETGQMKNYFLKADGKETLPQFIDFNDIHTRVVEEHVQISNSISDFVEQLSAVSLHALYKIRDEPGTETITKLHHEDLRYFTLQS